MLGLRTQIEGPIGSLGMLTFYPLGRYVEILTKRNVAAKIEYFAFRSLRNHYGPYQRRHSETTMEPERRDQLI